VRSGQSRSYLDCSDVELLLDKKVKEWEEVSLSLEEVERGFG